MLYFLVWPQIEPLDKIEYIARHAICCDWTCDLVSRLVTFNHMLNYVSTQLVSFPWLNLSGSSPMNQLKSFQSWYGSIESYSLFLWMIMTPMFFPSPSAWKMVNDAPNHIPENMNG